MEISYVMNTDDYRAWNRYVLRHPRPGTVRRPPHWGWGMVLLFGWLWLIMRWLGRLWENRLDIPFLITLTIATILCLCSFFWFRIAVWLIVRAQSPADKAKMASVHNISITPEALLHSSEHDTDKTAWLGIQRVVVTDDHGFFFILSQAGHGVPRRAFASDEAFRKFADTAQRYKREAEEQARSSPPEAEEQARSSPPASRGVGSPKWCGQTAEPFRSADEREQFRADEPQRPKDAE